MEKLLEYSRMVFEEAYMQEENPFRCIKAQVRAGYSNCICIPGIAINYIVWTMKCCYENIAAMTTISWNEVMKTYLPESIYMGQRLVFNLKSEGDARICYFADELCCEDIIDVYPFIKIRKKDDLKNEYKKEFLIESLLFGKFEKFNNSMDHLRFFCFIADIYRLNFEMDVYTDGLFRLFLFLFPNEGLSAIEDNVKIWSANTDSINYHRSILEQFLQLSSAQNVDGSEYGGKITDIACRLKEFCGFDVLNIYEKNSKTDPCIVRGLLNTQMDKCYKLNTRIQALLRICESFSVN